MNVLSLFDGMSCGRVALERAGIKVDKYYASELDKWAIIVAQANCEDTIQLGDVTRWREWDIDWSSIGLLIGGSPCQGFSFAGKGLAFDDPRSALFFVYVDILNHIRSVNPSVKFLLENVKMKKEHLRVIDEYLGVDHVCINSSRVSAQNRVRYYWANWEFGQPEDKGIMLSDILDLNLPSDEIGLAVRQKSKTVRVGGRNSPIDSKNEWDSPFIRVDKKMKKKTNQSKSACLTGGGNSGGNHSDMDILMVQRPRGFNKGGIKAKDGKTPTLSSSSWEHNNKIMFTGEGDEEDVSYRRFTPTECERLQTLSDGYTAHVSNSQRYKMIGNGWTIDVIVHIFKTMGTKKKEWYEKLPLWEGAT